MDVVVRKAAARHGRGEVDMLVASEDDGVLIEIVVKAQLG
jgi:hypothetical protein